MQTILGAGGAIGVELAKSLTDFTTDIRLVGRNPKAVNSADTLFSADLSKPEQVLQAVQGSDVCYLTIGFPYSTAIWQAEWVRLMQNVINACAEHNAKLVFFDNVYAIGGDNVRHITEQSPISPSSKKGEVRAAVDRLILEAVERGKIQAIIARAPDFFSEIKTQSLLMNMVYDNFAKSKAAQWFCNADVPHSTGYTPDLARGTAMLGNTPDAFNQVWNLPVHNHAPTGREWAAMFAEEMHVKNRIQVLPMWGLRGLGLFVPILKEMVEMCYQYDREYFFDSSKFTSRFSYTPTDHKEAIKRTIARLKQG